ncbi:DNA adenine methylase [Metasolibacillus meyeri]|uniref:site-specific DNA-methyltransferase (adenine-specific) n=1 Tax=Metasolibacillus meyeri TaxID=1071052 RepID=A0AAW9NUN9_9BACL|nr:DNA adenine methylase [Metasolibacillus meyeri]MEC1178556.1 DNA adenine methylase [Metasolibacillus meyeri]
MDSFIAWVGGKKLLRKGIVARFPEGVGRYIEVFGGAGWVLFHKEKHAKIEIYNDANNELVNLFRCVKFHCEELQRELEFSLNSRVVFNDYQNQQGLTDIQRAARFFTILKHSYGAKGQTYGARNRNMNKVIHYLKDIQVRLNDVVIENRDFEQLINSYDREDALFYLDPPYYETESYYKVEFKREDHLRLFSALANIKGKFVLSYNDCDFVRELYKAFNIEETHRNNNLAARYTGKDKKYKELIIKNF